MLIMVYFFIYRLAIFSADGRFFMDKQINILMATMGMEIGGAETHVLELSRELKRRDFNIIVASNGGVYEKELENAGIKHYSLPLHTKNPLSMIKSYKGLRRIIKEENIDIVHGHARIPSFLCGLLHKKMGFPFVTTAHWVFKTDFVLRNITNWGQKTIAVSNDIKKYLIDNYGTNKDDISVTINGIDTEKFSANIDASDVEAEFELSNDKTRIVYVSRMDTDRSLAAHHLVEITQKLYKEIENLEIVIVGGGNDFDALKAKADKVNDAIGQNVIKLTNGRTDINKFIKTGDIFVGVSRAALEAMAAAKPVIVAGNEGYIGIFDESKLDESIKTNFTCRDCRKPSSELLYNDIITLLKPKDKEKLEKLGQYCRQIILDHYSVNRMAQDAIDAYASVLNEKSDDCDVIISGYYGFKNNGDDALLSAIIGDLREQNPDIKICVLSYSPSDTAQAHNVDTINRFNFIKIAQKAKKAKLLISGGGSLIQDGTSTQSLLYYLAIMKIAKRCGCKCMLYANGIGPIVHKKNVVRARKVLSTLDLITLRDPDSLKELENLGVTDVKTVLTADPAFNITPAPSDEVDKIFKGFGIENTDKLLGISVRQWKHHGDEFEQSIAKIADYMHDEYGYTPVFINMQYPVDVKVSLAIIEKMKTKAYVIGDNVTDTQMLGIISKMDMVLGERLHTLIYAAVANVAFVGIVYDPKIKSFMEYIGQTNYIDTKNVSFELLKEKLTLCKTEQDKDTLIQKNASMKELAKKNALLASELIDKKQI
ncbi:MAG: polysaccharide pyruvyl transferase CsaB [Ruminococcaceae bacterium]|nr:polysaccharide pyruvyl transferase CsaB [Oscillospiraceae bacterium]